jgi:dTDP-4-amino-4,6-dideoxygalactose transaminase
VEHIPLVDLKAQHAAVADEVAAGFASVLERTAFVLGDEVDAFEREFAEFSGAPHCVGVGNGTDAVELALRAVGVGDGAEVILPANTFIATAEAVVRAGATPVLVDCDPEHQLIDVDAAVARIGPATRAIVPVHLFGQLAPVDALAARLGADGPLIVEDAAQCQGATHDGAGPATVGVAAATSFYPGKNLGAYGEAGAVLTRDAEVDRRLRSLRNHGSEAKYEHPELGFNSRLDTLQAVVLRAKLARLAAGNAARRAAARRYDALLRDVGDVTLPVTAPGNEHVWHLYVVRVPRRDAVLAALHDAGIGAGVHYPIPVHLQGAFRDLGHVPGDFPEAERAAHEILSLPLFPEITEQQQQRVAETLEKALV